MKAARALVVAAALIVPSACGADPTGSAPGESSAVASASAGPVSLVGGGTVDPEELSVTKPVALWFWAPG